jgi:hypothetical protein
VDERVEVEKHGVDGELKGELRLGLVLLQPGSLAHELG